jgi:hypothetical protein
MTHPVIDVAGLVDELADLNDKAAHIDERAKTIKAILLEQLQPGSHTIAGHLVTVKSGAARLDVNKVAANHPFEQMPELYKNAVDISLARKHLAPAELEGYESHGAPSVVVK